MHQKKYRESRRTAEATAKEQGLWPVGIDRVDDDGKGGGRNSGWDGGGWPENGGSRDIIAGEDKPSLAVPDGFDITCREELTGGGGDIGGGLMVEEFRHGLG